MERGKTGDVYIRTHLEPMLDVIMHAGVCRESVKMHYMCGVLAMSTLHARG